MNRDVIESQWTQIRELLSEKFSNLTEEDLRQINGRYDQLVAKLQQKYGYTRDEAEEKIRNWNFDRFAGPRSQYVREERIIRKEESSSNAWKWLLGIGIPLLLLASYFLGTRNPETTTRAPANNQQQFLVESPADRAISNNVRNALLSQTTASDLSNLRITTENGIVTLSGSVSSADARDSIVSTAQNLPGVRQVVNNLQVR